jgi:hypothetical protein
VGKLQALLTFYDTMTINSRCEHLKIVKWKIVWIALLLYPSQNSFWIKSKNYFARVKSSAPFVRGKSSAFFSPGITATRIYFFEKPKTKPVLVYLQMAVR